MSDTKAGFTVIELLLAMAIIGILAAVLIPNLLDIKQQTNDRAAEAMAREILNAMAAVEAGNPAGDLPSCTYGSSGTRVISGAELVNINTPTPVTNVLCENVPRTGTVAESYKVTMTYTGGSQASRIFNSFK